MRLDLLVYKNSEKSQSMAQYMRDKFVFIGIDAPKRKEIFATTIKNSKTWNLAELLQEVVYYYNKEHREYQYLAISLLDANYKRIPWDKWQEVVFPLITVKAWWDSVDGIKNPIASYLRLHSDYLADFIKTNQLKESIWERRLAIIIQLKYKKETNVALLEQAILACMHDQEFFIQKGIAWALREYSKTDSLWVKNFLQKHEFSKLVMREATKYL